VSSAVAEFCDRGLLSEARMAESYVAERIGKGFGPLRIREELRQKGISDALIGPVLEKSSQEWLELMAQVHDKRFGSAPTDDPRDMGRRARFLQSRGFPADLIGRFLDDDLLF
jgi:regulatory protein